MYLTFDEIKIVLAQRANQLNADTTSPEGMILFLEEDGDHALSTFILDKLPFLATQITLPFKFGIVYRYGSHTTPLVIELIDEAAESKLASAGALSNESSEFSETERSDLEEAFCLSINIYSTDSRAFDAVDGEDLRKNLLRIVAKGCDKNQLVTLYALGLIPSRTMDCLNTTRQHSDSGCAVFSLIDIETLLAESITPLSRIFKHVEEVNADDFSPPVGVDYFGRTHLKHIRVLPNKLAITMQSLHGDAEYNGRRGLEQWLEEVSSPATSDAPFDLAIPEGSCGYKFVTPEEKPMDDLLRLIMESAADSRVGHINVGTLYQFIQHNELGRNFVVSALSSMYARSLLRGDLDFKSIDKLDARKLHVTDLLQLVDQSHRVGISPLQRFVDSSPRHSFALSASVLPESGIFTPPPPLGSDHSRTQSATRACSLD